ncbi:MAG: hypothetical protein HC901_02745 [Bdellovibrionaceae bacterium]|nr:hypothetical protein [Pseudobdellovibrionaceae bacterium]
MVIGSDVHGRSGNVRGEFYGPGVGAGAFLYPGPDGFVQFGFGPQPATAWLLPAQRTAVDLWINITPTTWAEFAKAHGLQNSPAITRLQTSPKTEFAYVDGCFGQVLRPDLLAILQHVQQGLASGAWTVTAVDTTPPVYRKVPLRSELFEVKGWDPKSGTPPLPPVGQR